MNLIALMAMSAAEAEQHGNVAVETLIFGGIAAVIFTAMGMVTLSYRHVSNRHAAKAEAWARRHGKAEHGAGHGH